MPWRENFAIVNVHFMNDDGLNETFWFNHDDLNISPSDHKKSLKKIQRILNKHTRLLAHNIKFDLMLLHHLKLDTKHMKKYCTMISEYLLRNQDGALSWSLDETSLRYGLPQKLDKVKMFWDAGYNTTAIPLKILTEYVARDVELVKDIYPLQVSMAKKRGLSFMKLMALQMRFSEVLCHAEYYGMPFDVNLAVEFAGYYKKRLERYDKDLIESFGIEGINLGSGDDLSVGLYGGYRKRKVKMLKTKVYKKAGIKVSTINCDYWEYFPGVGFTPLKGSETKKHTDERPNYKTGKDVIPSLKAKTPAQRLVKRIFANRAATAQQLSTFFIGLQEKLQCDGRVHGSLNQCITVTGRLSSSDPNLQNFPSRGCPAKLLFPAKRGYIVDADLSSAEWIGAAFITQDPVMIEEILSGIDIHTANAIAIFGDASYRQVCKVFTFRSLYGGNEWGFFYDSAFPDWPIKRWKEICDNFYKKYKGLKKYHDKCIKEVRKTGSLTTPSGRSFAFKKIVKKGVEDYSQPQIKNYPMQSFATADLQPLNIVTFMDKLAEVGLPDLPMFCTVHDSDVYDVADEEICRVVRCKQWVYNNFPKIISEYFSIDFNIPMGGDITIGKRYSETPVTIKGDTVTCIWEGVEYKIPYDDDDKWWSKAKKCIDAFDKVESTIKKLKEEAAA